MTKYLLHHLGIMCNLGLGVWLAMNAFLVAIECVCGEPHASTYLQEMHATKGHMMPSSPFWGGL